MVQLLLDYYWIPACFIAGIAGALVGDAVAATKQKKTKQTTKAKARTAASAKAC
jgi:hypothetical protein